MSAETGAAIEHLRGVLEELGWLEESITYGRARWVLTSDEGQSATITITTENNGGTKVSAKLEPFGEHPATEITAGPEAVQQGILPTLSGRQPLTLSNAIEFTIRYARLIAFRPSDPSPQPPPRPLRG